MRTKLYTGAGMLVATAGVVFGLALAFSDDHSADAQEMDATAADVVGSSQPVLGVLRRGATPEDALPSRQQQLLDRQGLEAAPGTPPFGGARRSVSDGVVTVWVVPLEGGGAACLLQTDGEVTSFSCHTDERIAAGEATVTTTGLGGLGVIRLAGLLPDGATDVQLHMDDGQTVAVAVGDNTFATAVAGLPDHLDWQAANGERRTAPLAGYMPDAAVAG